ncbi:MAG: hypothetical protein ACLPHI_20050 [Terriglobales bacterium]
MKRKVIANTRTGIPIQRGFSVLAFAMPLGYTIACRSQQRAATQCAGRIATLPRRDGAEKPGSNFLAGEHLGTHPAFVRYNIAMSQSVSAITRSPAEIVQNSPVSQAPNGICYARSGEITIADHDLDRMIAAVPVPIASALSRKAYYFVPLTVTQGDDTVIADRYDVGLSDNAVCHRNLNLGDAQCVFISTRLMEDKFSVAFEFYINVGHALVERAGVSQNFADLAWQQVESGVRGETSLDAWEARKFATAHGPDAEKYKTEYLASSFADAISIYLLSLYLDVDYYDLRERDYPLLAPTPMAERLRKIAEIFPPTPGFEFNIYYRRRS